MVVGEEDMSIKKSPSKFRLYIGYTKFLGIYLGCFIIVVFLSACYVQKKVKEKNSSLSLNMENSTSSVASLNSKKISSNKYSLRKFLQEEKKNEEKKEGMEKYKISAGDELEIFVWGEPEMTKKIIVQPDGYISYFLIGELKAEGKTIAELKKEITSKLVKYIRNPNVTIIIKKFTSKESSAVILGAVNNPGRYTIKKNTRILDLIAMANGLKYNSSGEPVYNLRASYLARKGKLAPVDFNALLEQGDISQNMLLKSGDFIYIASSRAQGAFVVGAVKSPKKIRFDVGITLLDAIASAGGLLPGAKTTFYIVRNSLIHPKILKINYKKILQGKEKNIYLKPGDIVYVPRRFLSKLGELPNKILPFLDLIIESNAAYNVVK